MVLKGKFMNIVNNYEIIKRPNCLPCGGCITFFLAEILS